MKTRTVALLFAMSLAWFALPALGSDVIAEYPVRWKHGGTTDFGKLVVTTASIIFRGDDGEVLNIPYLYLNEVKIVDGNWIQLRSNRESGLSFGHDDIYNFGVVGGTPDPAVVERANQLIAGTKEVRIANAQKLPGERARYMVSKGETIGDDVGVLIITESRLLYRSDTGGKDHDWSYGDLRAIEVDDKGNLHVRTSERAVIKVGLSYRNYMFVTQVGDFRGEDIGFLIDKVREAKQ